MLSPLYPSDFSGNPPAVIEHQGQRADSEWKVDTESLQQRLVGWAARPLGPARPLDDMQNKVAISRYTQNKDSHMQNELLIMVHVICPNVEKQALKMMEELHQMRLENDHCDFIVEVGDDVYYTHKNVLSAGSNYFKAMLKHDTNESREGRVVLKDVDSECVKNCIDFIYSRKFEISNEKMDSILHVAIMMQLEDVKHAVSDILAESLTVTNYYPTLNLADMYGLDSVSATCGTFFHENIMEISDQPEFRNIDKNHFITLLKSRKSILREQEKLILSLNWIENNPRKKLDLHECLEVIKFDKITLASFQDLLETHPIISNDFELYKLLTQHLLEAKKRQDETEEDFDDSKLIILFDDDTDCIRCFNPTTERVEKFHDETFKHLKYFSAIANGSYIYVLCKDKSVQRLNYQIKNSKWEKMKDMIHDHGGNPRSVSLLGSIFVIGGSSGVTSSAVETFNSSANQWFQLQNKPTAIAYAGLVSLDDSIYCIGGKGADGVAVSSFCRFTPSSSVWVDLEPMRFPVYGSGAVAVDQKIFVIGGAKSGERVKNVECYNVASAEWTSLSSMNTISRNKVCAYHIGNWILAVRNLETSNVFEKYDISNDEWNFLKSNLEQYFRIFSSTIVKI